jgi:hypothetical protein
MLKTDEWVESLDANEHGDKVLTLQQAFVIAAQGGTSRRFIAPFALQWSVGRETHYHQRFYVSVTTASPLRFTTARTPRSFGADSSGCRCQAI